ncbi:MAG: hypothetical protein HRU18_01455 [Pseudoalteromonas sp.]|uniref:hypothetical protein n=1 Tax=Pseudoalteromonas sp. TaxID=53249 RepID=UPI001DDCCF92|nr:hypothetical protein [Pseudoalteromonas sp.]NRA76847.1 hypothetical protein [Pseudoalteromonas sp.]
MELSKVRRASYNPRTMNSSARDGLRESMNDFGDISGIVINKQTNNILAGNHRFDELSKKHGRGNLKLNHLEGEWYSLDLKDGKTTGFKARVVDWDLEKEQLANVVANNDMITGEYTSDLQPLLKKLSVKMPKVKMDALKVSPMMIDDSMESDLDLEDEYETPEIVKEKSEESSRKRKEKDIDLDADDPTAPSNVREIVGSIKVIAPADILDELKFDILEALSGKDYYDDINIIKG